MTLVEALESADAPDELKRWAADGALDLDTAWEDCRRGDHRLWLAACAGAPIDALIEAAAAVVYLADERAPESPETIGAALDLAIAGADSAQLLAAAAACEHIADGGSADYRSPSGPGTEARARAAALVAHAAEALIAGEARHEAARLEQARATGAALGVGMQGAFPPDAGPARLNVIAAAADPAQGSFLFAVAASAQAVADVADALRRAGGDPDRIDRELDAVVRAVLDGA